MGEGHKNATKTVTCQIDDLRLVAGNLICLVSAELKIVWRTVTCLKFKCDSGGAQPAFDVAGEAQNPIFI
jgi:hypothetical protein